MVFSGLGLPQKRETVGHSCSLDAGTASAGDLDLRVVLGKSLILPMSQCHSPKKRESHLPLREPPKSSEACA